MRDQNLEVNPDFVDVLTQQRGRRRGGRAGMLSVDLYGQTLVVGAGAKVRQILSASATLDFPNTLAQTSQDLTITVAGAADGDPVFVGAPNGSVNANTCFTAWVSAANVCTVRHNNYSAVAVDPASGVFRVCVFKF
jgi:hypothetical protein